jgi:hypothetical protein
MGHLNTNGTGNDIPGNIYHCCIQKTGSQWFKKVFTDDIIWKQDKLLMYSPRENFITDNEAVLNRLLKLPDNLIVGPLYIRYNKFITIKKPENCRAFFIARDPRDLIVSNYFSLKHSHSPYDPYILKMREKLNNMTEEDGITELIDSLAPGIKNTLEGWFSQDSVQIKLIKFEDFFGNNQLNEFTDLLEFCNIQLPSNDVEYLLDKYSFKKISGRKLGTEDVKNHYRKGTPGDWKNHFTVNHKNQFKQIVGELLQKCNYESNDTW